MVLVTVVLAIISFTYLNNQRASSEISIFSPKKDTLYVIKHGKFDSKLNSYVVQELESFYKLPVKQLPDLPLIKGAYNPAGRYTASIILDSVLIRHSSKRGVLVVLTEKDITVENKARNAPYWGIFGLAYLQPFKRQLNACVISTHRMKTNLHDRLSKVTLHEVGHAKGLPHCDKDPFCLMRDAKGLGKTIDGVNKNLCTRCEQLYRVNRERITV